MHPETTHASPTPSGTATPGQPAAESLLQAAVCAISLDDESTAGNVGAQLSTSAVSSPGLSPPRKRKSFFANNTGTEEIDASASAGDSSGEEKDTRANERGQLHLRSAPPFPVSRTADLSPKSARSRWVKYGRAALAAKTDSDFTGRQDTGNMNTHRHHVRAELTTCPACSAGDGPARSTIFGPHDLFTTSKNAELVEKTQDRQARHAARALVQTSGTPASPSSATLVQRTREFRSDPYEYLLFDSVLVHDVCPELLQQATEMNMFLSAA